MAISIQAYGHLTESVSGIDWDNDEFKLVLLDDSYTPDINGDQFYSDLTGEVSGSGYTSGGKVIGSTGATYSGGELTFDGDDVSWDPVSLSGVRYGVVYDNTPSDPEDKQLAVLIDFGEDQSTGSGGNFNVAWHTDGIVTIEANPE